MSTPLLPDDTPARARPAVRPGVTLLELLIVVVMIGIMTAVMVPRMRVSESSRVRSVAAQLSNDLELVRSRGLQARRPLRVVFDRTEGRYTAFLADSSAGVVTESAAERDSVRVFRGRTLPDGVVYGRGAAPALPDESGEAITFLSDRVNFSTRGMPEPLGTRGVVYLQSAGADSSVSAVATSGAGAFRVWTWINGEWR